MPSPPPEHTADNAHKLFEKIEAKFPSESLGHERWYLITVSIYLFLIPLYCITRLTVTAKISALTGGNQATHAADLYAYLISKPQYETPDARKVLVRRLREALVKDVSIIGVPKCLEAVFSIAKVEREEDRDFSFSREKWQSGEKNHERGVAWLNQIYQRNRASTVSALNAHRDFGTSSICLFSLSPPFGLTAPLFVPCPIREILLILKC